MRRSETVSGADGRKKEQKEADFVIARLISPSVATAAQSAKISRAQAYRYLKNPEILRRLREASHGAIQLAAALGQAGALEGIERLRWLLKNADSESVQALAAKALLEFGVKTGEISYILDRLDVLEKIAKSGEWKGLNDDKSTQQEAEGDRKVNGHG